MNVPDSMTLAELRMDDVEQGYQQLFLVEG